MPCSAGWRPTLTTDRVEVLVIGRGMIGTAAAWHLARAGVRVALLGQREPENYAAHQGAFASHYDQARITRTLDSDPIWAELARRAIAQYGELEAASGVRFFHQSGFLAAGGAVGGEAFVESSRRIADRLRLPYEPITHDTLIRRFPAIAWADDDLALYQSEAGWINPRRQVEAAVMAASEAGARTIDGCARSLERTSGGIVVTTLDGQRLNAERVLLATGAFSHAFPLQQAPLKLSNRARTVTLLQPSPEHEAAMRQLPTIIYDPTSGLENGFYLLPAIDYPDGRCWMKLGLEAGPASEDADLRQRDELHRWFNSEGDPRQPPLAARLLRDFLPGVEFQAIRGLSCVTTYTESGHPYVGAIDDRLSVAIGGCGFAAKSSLAIGQLAASTLIHDTWQDELDPAAFRPQTL